MKLNPAKLRPNSCNDSRFSVLSNGQGSLKEVTPVADGAGSCLMKQRSATLMTYIPFAVHPGDSSPIPSLVVHKVNYTYYLPSCIKLPLLD